MLAPSLTPSWPPSGVVAMGCLWLPGGSTKVGAQDEDVFLPARHLLRSLKRNCLIKWCVGVGEECRCLGGLSGGGGFGCILGWSTVPVWGDSLVHVPKAPAV